MNDKATKLLVKIATKDKGVAFLSNINALKKQAYKFTKKPDPVVVGEVAEQTPAGNVEAEVVTAKPSYLDALKNRAGGAWGWTKGKWNAMSPEARDTVGAVGLGIAGGAAGDALVRLLGGKRSKALRLLGMLGGVGAGMAANSYLQKPDFKTKVDNGLSSLISKLKA